jgi:hypothetical protein
MAETKGSQHRHWVKLPKRIVGGIPHPFEGEYPSKKEANIVAKKYRAEGHLTSMKRTGKYGSARYLYVAKLGEDFDEIERPVRSKYVEEPE